MFDTIEMAAYEKFLANNEIKKYVFALHKGKLWVRKDDCTALYKVVFEV